MRLYDWNNYRNWLVEAAASFSKLSPDPVKGHATLPGAGERTGYPGQWRFGQDRPVGLSKRATLGTVRAA
jgi:hypothetical protein